MSRGATAIRTVEHSKSFSLRELDVLAILSDWQVARSSRQDRPPLLPNLVNSSHPKHPADICLGLRPLRPDVAQLAPQARDCCITPRVLDRHCFDAGSGTGAEGEARKGRHHPRLS